MAKTWGSCVLNGALQNGYVWLLIATGLLLLVAELAEELPTVRRVERHEAKIPQLHGLRASGSRVARSGGGGWVGM